MLHFSRTRRKFEPCDSLIVMTGIFQKEILGEKSARQSTDVLLVINWWLISGLIEAHFMLD